MERFLKLVFRNPKISWESQEPRFFNYAYLFVQFQPPALVIYFEASEATLVNRLLKRAETSGRADDNEVTIKKRLHTFVEATKPVVEHYEKQQKLIKVRLIIKDIGS